MFYIYICPFLRYAENKSIEQCVIIAFQIYDLKILLKNIIKSQRIFN